MVKAVFQKQSKEIIKSIKFIYNIQSIIILGELTQTFQIFFPPLESPMIILCKAFIPLITLTFPDI